MFLAIKRLCAALCISHPKIKLQYKIKKKNNV